MKLNEISDNAGARRGRMRIGRGIGSGKGKTGGRGVRIKGFEGGQMPLHRRLPKRGFNNIFAIKLNVVNLDRIQAAIDRGALDAKETVDVEALVRGGVLRRAKDGVRLLGRGEINVPVQFAVHGASKAAIATVEKAGGTVKVLAPAEHDKTAP
jgi:large subunit ribosomal protein L15